ncbi:uncharacterized protein LOC122577433 isoform X2 [Bombus pyrosoma]|uniref:uncharacterized protein LOC122577433 isoform X2 n=1 Tax=Bombus pyrosoma TaxID=396416 RepID=UPI001CB9521C|nr:uncharacterized protein LOC122577433 isoform X2 [Bombus pyrosoma]
MNTALSFDVCLCVMVSGFDSSVRYRRSNNPFPVFILFILSLFGILVVPYGYVGYGHGSTCICPTCTKQEEERFPKMCGRLVKTIQMNVRRLTSPRRLLSESWIFSCVTALVVRAIFSAVCSQYMERLREMCLDVLVIMILNGEYRGVFVKGSLCRLSCARRRWVPKFYREDDPDDCAKACFLEETSTGILDILLSLLFWSERSSLYTPSTWRDFVLVIMILNKW